MTTRRRQQIASRQAAAKRKARIGKPPDPNKPLLHSVRFEIPESIYQQFLALQDPPGPLMKEIVLDWMAKQQARRRR